MNLNPIYKNEIILSGRSRQMPVLITIFNIVLFTAAMLSFHIILLTAGNNGTSPYFEMPTFYFVMLTVQICMMAVFVPPTAGGSIAGERERKTLDILLASGLPPARIIAGKWLSSVSLAILMLISGIPMFALTLLYGGIHLSDVWGSALYTAFFVLILGAVGVFCSTCFKRTTSAIIAAYGLILVMNVGTFILTFVLAAVDILTSTISLPGILMSFVLLLNPAVTYGLILDDTMIARMGLRSTMESIGILPVLTEHWVFLSILAQALLMILLLLWAGRRLNPLKGKNQ